MKRLALIALVMLATPAYAKDITVTLTDTEQQQFLALLDLAVKQGGIQAAGAASFFAQKLRTEQQKQAEPVTPPAPPPAENNP